MPDPEKLLTTIDRGAILLMLYSAFGKSVVGGVWLRISGVDLLAVVAVCVVLLALVLVLAVVAARRYGFARADEAAIVFCGSMKSLVTGMPMAVAAKATICGGTACTGAQNPHAGPARSRTTRPTTSPR